MSPRIGGALLERNARVGQLQLYDDLRAILCALCAWSEALGLVFEAPGFVLVL